MCTIQCARQSNAADERPHRRREGPQRIPPRQRRTACGEVAEVTTGERMHAPVTRPGRRQLVLVTSCGRRCRARGVAWLRTLAPDERIDHVRANGATRRVGRGAFQQSLLHRLVLAENCYSQRAQRDRRNGLARKKKSTGAYRLEKLERAIIAVFERPPIDVVVER